MYLLITTSGDMSLQEIDDMKRFSIRESCAGCASEALSQIGETTEDDHYWLDADAVIAMSSKSGDPQWVESFWQMLKAVEAYGYSDLQNKRVKAHVKLL